jgi:MFS family permease
VVVERTDSPLAVTLAGFFRYVPFLFAGPFVGLIADRFPRIRIVQYAEAGTALSAAVIATLAFTDRIEVWHLYLFALVAGTLWVMAMPARRAYMVGVVGRKNMTPALALDMLGWTVSNIVASNFAGRLLSVVQPAWLYAWLVVASGISLSLLRGLPLLWRPASPAERQPVLGSMREGLRYVVGSRLLLGAVAIVAITNMTGFLFEIMTPVFAEEVLHTGPAGLGLLISAPSFGALITGFALTVRGRRLTRPGFWLFVAGAVQHGLTILWSYSGWYPVSFGILAVTGLFTFLFGTMNSNVFLAATPDAMRGRIQGLQIFVIGVFPLSALIVGALANAIGPAAAVRWMAVGGSLALAFAWFMFPELRRPVPPPAEPEGSVKSQVS